jgi:hypothetical protein
MFGVPRVLDDSKVRGGFVWTAVGVLSSFIDKGLPYLAPSPLRGVLIVELPECEDLGPALWAYGVVDADLLLPDVDEPLPDRARDRFPRFELARTILLGNLEKSLVDNANLRKDCGKISAG